MEKKKLSALQIIAIYGIFFTGMGVSAVSPAMAKFRAQFPNNNYLLISTMPTLTMLPTTLWAGSIAGKKVPYKTLSIVGIILFIIGGLTPFFWTSSFTGIILCRAVFGIGAGLRASLGNALIYNLIDKEKQAASIGYGTLVSNIGGIAFQMAGGALAEIGWNYTFLAYLFGFLSLALAFVQPEPEMVKIEATEEKKEKRPLPRAVFILAGLFFVFVLLQYPTMMNMSLIFNDKNAGNATAAATALSLYTVGGCVMGLSFGKVFSVLKKWIIPVGYFGAAIGVALIYFGPDALVMSIGALILGGMFSTLSPTGYALLARYVPKDQSALAISVVMAISNVAGFGCPYFLKLLKALGFDTLYFPLLLQIIACCFFAVFFIFINPLKNDK